LSVTGRLSIAADLVSFAVATDVPMTDAAEMVAAALRNDRRGNMTALENKASTVSFIVLDFDIATFLHFTLRKVYAH
jgi:hypothetical protein